MPRSVAKQLSILLVFYCSSCYLFFLFHCFLAVRGGVEAFIFLSVEGL